MAINHVCKKPFVYTKCTKAMTVVNEEEYILRHVETGSLIDQIYISYIPESTLEH